MRASGNDSSAEWRGPGTQGPGTHTEQADSGSSRGAASDSVGRGPSLRDMERAWSNSEPPSVHRSRLLLGLEPQLARNDAVRQQLARLIQYAQPVQDLMAAGAWLAQRPPVARGDGDGDRARETAGQHPAQAVSSAGLAGEHPKRGGVSRTRAGDAGAASDVASPVEALASDGVSWQDVLAGLGRTSAGAVAVQGGSADPAAAGALDGTLPLRSLLGEPEPLCAQHPDPVELSEALPRLRSRVRRLSRWRGQLGGPAEGGSRAAAAAAHDPDVRLRGAAPAVRVDRAASGRSHRRGSQLTDASGQLTLSDEAGAAALAAALVRGSSKRWTNEEARPGRLLMAVSDSFVLASVRINGAWGAGRARPGRGLSCCTSAALQALHGRQPTPLRPRRSRCRAPPVQRLKCLPRLQATPTARPPGLRQSISLPRPRTERWLRRSGRRCGTAGAARSLAIQAGGACTRQAGCMQCWAAWQIWMRAPMALLGAPRPPGGQRLAAHARRAGPSTAWCCAR